MSDKEQTNQTLPDLSSVLSTLMADPQVMQLISSMKNTVSSPENGDAPRDPQKSGEDSKPPQDSQLEALLPMVSKMALKSDPTPSSDPRLCLLNALKPYLSPVRRNAVDTIVRLSSLSEILGKIKL